MATTGWRDTFNRTVANGLGTADSSQGYSITAPATQWSVAPSTALLTFGTAGERFGYVDFRATSIDVTGQVALQTVPVTNQAFAGFVSKVTNSSNYYAASMMVASTGVISLRFHKLVAGVQTTISTTVATGLTYVANTFYNLRYQIFWSRPLQTNVMSVKLWVVGGVEPGGWMAVANDAAFTDYTSGDGMGIYGRDDSTAPAVNVRFRSIAARGYQIPFPFSSEPMCYDPAITFPKQTNVESMADVMDAAATTIDPFSEAARHFPRVRVSRRNWTFATAPGGIPMAADTTEFNIGTPTNLGYDNAAIFLPVGVWVITFEIQLKEAGNNFFRTNGFTGIAGVGATSLNFRSNPVNANSEGVGGTGHVSALTYSLDPTTPLRVGYTVFPNNTATTYTITYMAISAIKISDYFA